MEQVKKENIKNIVFTNPLYHNGISKLKSFILKDDICMKPVLKTHSMEMAINWRDDKMIINIPLEPMAGEIFKLVEVIELIEETSELQLQKSFVLFKEFRSCITNINTPLYDYPETELAAKICCSTIQDFAIYDNKGNLCNKNDISGKKYNYTFVLEFSDIWYNYEKRCGGCNFIIIQAKIDKLYHQENLFFSTHPTIPKTTPPGPPIKAAPPPALPPPNPTKDIESKPAKSFERLQVDPKDLIDMKNRLKKTDI